MREIIATKLEEIAKDENVTILYACESGSRGWRFSSVDSDYDVRFLYLRKIERYLSIHPVRDVIELPISNQLDIVGWDFRKALQLLQRSNSRLLEWISSPVVYVQPYEVIEELWQLAPTYFSPLVCGKHYYRTACHYFSLAVQGERIQVKAMFYALRTLLAVNWIEKIGSPVPMDFWVSAERILTSSEIKEAIQQLYVAKGRTSEQAQIVSIPILETFCTEEIRRLETIVPHFEHRIGPDEPLNRLYQRALWLDKPPPTA